MFDREALGCAIAAHGVVARVVIAAHDGSSPREVGAAMLVWAGGQAGTIGGGALEWEALGRAREMLVAVAASGRDGTTGGGAAGLDSAGALGVSAVRPSPHGGGEVPDTEGAEPGAGGGRVVASEAGAVALAVGAAPPAPTPRGGGEVPDTEGAEPGGGGGGVAASEAGAVALAVGAVPPSPHGGGEVLNTDGAEPGAGGGGVAASTGSALPPSPAPSGGAGGGFAGVGAAEQRAAVAQAEPETFGARAPPRGEGMGGRVRVDRQALGPALGQCCGGAVTLLTEIYAAVPEGPVVARAVTGQAGDGRAMPLVVKRMLARARGQGVLPGPVLVQGWMVEPVTRPVREIWVWGAGHVGRAVVGVLAPLPGVRIVWCDVDVGRFPDMVPEGVRVVARADLGGAVADAATQAEHLVMTFSHALDLELCHRLLGHGFGRLGLIGSATKWARFRSRLAALGHGAGAIRRIECPIGDVAFGKHPQAIAIGVAARFLGTADIAERAAHGG